MLREDYNYLREILESLDNEYERGAFIPHYDNGEEKPYQLIVMGEELDDIENEENGINYLGDGDPNLIPCAARVEIERRFVMND